VYVLIINWDARIAGEIELFNLYGGWNKMNVSIFGKVPLVVITGNSQVVCGYKEISRST